MSEVIKYNKEGEIISIDEIIFGEISEEEKQNFKTLENDEKISAIIKFMFIQINNNQNQFDYDQIDEQTTFLEIDDKNIIYIFEESEYDKLSDEEKKTFIMIKKMSPKIFSIQMITKHKQAIVSSVVFTTVIILLMLCPWIMTVTRNIQITKIITKIVSRNVYKQLSVTGRIEKYQMYQFIKLNVNKTLANEQIQKMLIILKNTNYDPQKLSEITGLKFETCKKFTDLTLKPIKDLSLNIHHATNNKYYSVVKTVGMIKSPQLALIALTTIFIITTTTIKLKKNKKHIFKVNEINFIILREKLTEK